MMTCINFRSKLRPITQECVFPINKIGGPITVIFFDIYVFKMEEDIVIQAILYSINHMWVTLMHEEKIIDLNSYRKNIKFTLETNPKNLLGTEVIRTEISL